MKTWILKIEACGATQDEAVRQASMLMEQMIRGRHTRGYTRGNLNGNASGNWDEGPDVRGEAATMSSAERTF